MQLCHWLRMIPSPFIYTYSKHLLFHKNLSDIIESIASFLFGLKHSKSINRFICLALLNPPRHLIFMLWSFCWWFLKSLLIGYKSIMNLQSIVISPGSSPSLNNHYLNSTVLSSYHLVYLSFYCHHFFFSTSLFPHCFSQSSTLSMKLL